MRRRIVQVNEYSFDEKEAKLLQTCLDYCFHRLSSEENTGLNKAGVKQEAVDALRKELQAALKI